MKKTQANINKIKVEQAWDHYVKEKMAKHFDLNKHSVDAEKGEALCPICGQKMEKKKFLAADSTKKHHPKHGCWTIHYIDGDKKNEKLENLQPLHPECAAKAEDSEHTLKVVRKMKRLVAGKNPEKKPAAKPADKKPVANKPVDKKPVAKPVEKKPVANKPVEKQPAKPAEKTNDNKTIGQWVDRAVDKYGEKQNNQKK